MGNGTPEQYEWNDRFQLTRIAAGAAGNTLDLRLYPCDNGLLSCTNNNGNIWRQTIAIGGALRATQEYRYDAVDRLLVAAENPAIAPQQNCSGTFGLWRQPYVYDTAGNRSVGLGRYGDVNTAWDVASFSPAANRISAAGWQYDDAGNLRRAATGETVAYDAEDRQVAYCTQDPNGCVNAPGTGRTRYVYDGERRRVQRLAPDGSQTVFVYDAFGNLAADES